MSVIWKHLVFRNNMTIIIRKPYRDGVEMTLEIRVLKGKEGSKVTPKSLINSTTSKDVL